MWEQRCGNRTLCTWLIGSPRFNRSLKGWWCSWSSPMLPKVSPIFPNGILKGSPVTPSPWTPPPNKNPTNLVGGFPGKASTISAGRQAFQPKSSQQDVFEEVLLTDRVDLTEKWIFHRSLEKGWYFCCRKVIRFFDLYESLVMSDDVRFYFFVYWRKIKLSWLEGWAYKNSGNFGILSSSSSNIEFLWFLRWKFPTVWTVRAVERPCFCEG